MPETPTTVERPNVEWWNFDAVSDSGDEVVSIRFFRRYIFSSVAGDAAAVSFVFSSGGKQVCRSVSAFSQDAVQGEDPSISIGPNRFSRKTALYGAGNLVTLDLPLRRGRRVQAQLEWLNLDGDPDRSPFELNKIGKGDWRILSQRSDVSGKIVISGGTGREIVYQFRGTGSHSQYSDDSATGFGVRMSGSAHFVDSTVFFASEGNSSTEGNAASVAVAGDEETREALAVATEHYWTRTRYGIKYPRRFLLTSDDAKLRVKLLAPYESELCFARFPAEITLTVDNDKQRKAIGCVEILEPRRLKSNIVRWFSGLGVRKMENG